MPATKSTLEVDGRSISLSNLDKVMFPESGFTKAEVIDYYIRISAYLLPHLKGRPLTMKRFPDGVQGKFFYEKDAPAHTPEWVDTFEVPRKNSKDKIRYIVVNNLSTLVWSANLANLELHTFLARVPDIEKPTCLVFDLDPGPPADILTCAQVALWVREILASVKLECYPKVSGSKGIQLYVPLNTDADYELTSAFSLEVAEKLEQLKPDVVVSQMTKKLREGKVFIDWSQNSNFKTTVSVYSLRAKRETPYVSLPVKWEELETALKKQNLESLNFQPDAALKRVEKMGDLFAPVLKTKQKIPSGYEKKLTGMTSLSKPLAQEKKKKASKISAEAAAKRSTPRESRTPKDKPVSESLRSYHSKRNFAKTKEPSGKEKTAKPEKQDGLMFVIQKHQASQLHYDFRLEMEGVLRSWAVPKGPPTEKLDKRLAMHVEDHPFSYAKFEGTIAPGNYGAGTVMVWDIGTYEDETGDAVQAYYAGKLHMTLKGEKLKGEWVLVKTRKDQYGKESWILMKAGTSMPPIGPRKDDQSVLTGRTMKQIAADNDAQWVSNRKK